MMNWPWSRTALISSVLPYPPAFEQTYLVASWPFRLPAWFGRQAFLLVHWLLLSAMLAGVDFSHPLDVIGLFWRLVVADAQDAGEPQRITTGVAVGTHDGIKSDLQHDFGFHFPPEAVVGESVRQEPLGHVGDLFICESGIGFADIQQAIAVANREGVIAEHAHALAVPVFHRRDHNIECGQLALQLHPGLATPSGSVEIGRASC